ncbi:hypothetical protein SAMN05519104_4948 [Rhizobiales bacterium GAS188]|nr:hypothetical protein SAMN05519104_4948 [Rhizobiales bacterium GAS188]
MAQLTGMSPLRLVGDVRLPKPRKNAPFLFARFAMSQARLAFSDRSLIAVMTRGVEEVVRVDALRARFQVDALIRLHERDYDELEELRGRFVHFNLEVTLNEVGKRYAILPILRPGRRDATGREVLPLVDVGRHHAGRCEAVLQRVPIDEVPPHCFAHSLPSLRTVEALEGALIRRYAAVFPQLTERELLSRGCAITSLVLD